MPTETVSIQYVNEPKPGGQWWNIKTADGVRYNRKGAISKELEGKSAVITYDLGKDDFRKIIKIEAEGNGAAYTQPTQPRYNGKNEEDIAVLALAKSFIESGNAKDISNVSRLLCVLRDQWRLYKEDASEGGT